MIVRASRARSAIAAVLLFAFASPGFSAEGKIPRLANGKPDFSGIWQTLTPADYDLEPHSGRKDAPPGAGVIDGDSLPYLPKALEQKRRNFAARETLEAAGVATRVVSAPSLEWFAEQDEAYRESVLPSSVRARVSVEAGIALSWHKIVGDAGRSVSIEHYGASADAETLFREFGFTPEAVVAAAHESIAAARGDSAPASTGAVPTESGTGDQKV